MANVQRQFEQFHDAIKLDDENEILREKRERVLDQLKQGLNRDFSKQGKKPPTFTTFVQGSYAMGTGVKPVNGDYDIDVGIRFAIPIAAYPDPVEVKLWVYNALVGHTKRVIMRQPCVTVYYSIEGEPVYHVDLAVYSDGAANPDRTMYLARGKTNSDQAHRKWEASDPFGFIQLIKDRWKSDDGAQFRRTIRSLKRWRDVKFPAGGHAAPTGIALTVAAYNWFSPKTRLVDRFQNRFERDDLEALTRLVDGMIGNFGYVWSGGRLVERLAVLMPVKPYNDLLGKMTDAQMADFKERLETLGNVLRDAQGRTDPVEACELLQGQFGPDFPVPPRGETGQKRGPAILSSGSSA